MKSRNYIIASSIFCLLCFSPVFAMQLNSAGKLPLQPPPPNVSKGIVHNTSQPDSAQNLGQESQNSANPVSPLPLEAKSNSNTIIYGAIFSMLIAAVAIFFYLMHFIKS